MSRHHALLTLLGPIVAFTAHAEIYLSAEQAVQALFPGVALKRGSLQLSDEEIKHIEKDSDQSVRNKSLVLWRSSTGDSVYIDQVLGKHEFITIAVGITSDGKIKGIEVLEYRETYGQQVHEAPWRQQFVGKDLSSPLKLNGDIRNISGATLSSLHITNGVRRILVTNAIVHSRL